jgi:hypothetical protein
MCRWWHECSGSSKSAEFTQFKTCLAQQQQQCAGDMNLLAAANLLSSHNSRQAQQQSDGVVEQA